MALKINVLKVTFLLACVRTITGQDVTVNLQVDQLDNIHEGDRVSLSCEVSGSFNDSTDMVLIARRFGYNLRPLAFSTGISDNAIDKVKFDGWTVDNDTQVLSITILAIDRSDSGDYICMANRQTTSDETQLLNEQTIVLEVLFSPSGHPVCTMSPSNIDSIWTNGENITLHCFSNIGNPQGQLQWTNTGNITIPEEHIELSLDSIESTINLTLNENFHGVVFTCVRQNTAFPSALGVCLVGPIVIQDFQSRPEEVTGTPLSTRESVACTNQTTEAKTDNISSLITGIVIGISIGMCIFTGFALTFCAVKCSKKGRPKSKESQSSKTVSNDMKDMSSLYASIDHPEVTHVYL